VRTLSDTPVLTLPLPFASLAGAIKAQRRWQPPWRVVAFGYMNPNRRLDQILEALAGWCDAPPFQLDILGSVWDPAHIERRISEHGLQAQVRVHGFVEEAVLDDFVANAHLAFNLRHPTMGEASGGILRCWAQATPALVTDAGWYRDLPDSVAVKISVENEIEDIRKTLDRLTREPALYAAVGEAGLARLGERHAPERYASGLDEALQEFPRLAQRFAARRMLHRVADRLPRPAERRALLERSCLIAAALFG
jgi:glycosyltransferase involved in cell wall biosynthesis